MQIQAKCKICRRLGVKLFLKGERCFSPKCAIVKRPYPPGIQSKKGRRGLSEFNVELREKQKLRIWYLLSERQFRRYVKNILARRGKVEDAGVELMKVLEMRLDNVVFRMGFAPSRSFARQLITHGHFVVNGKLIRIPSYQVKVGDKIYIRPQSQGRAVFKNLPITIKKHKAPSWILLDPEKLEAKIVALPTLVEAAPPAEISAIFEFYSR